MITVWQKQEFDNERCIPPLRAHLTYQPSEDKQKIYCQIDFETPYPVAKTCLKDGIRAVRFGDKMLCYYVLEDGQYKTLRIDHPDQPIYGCTTHYNSDKSSIPYFSEPLFNMDIEIREGRVYMPERERQRW